MTRTWADLPAPVTVTDPAGRTRTVRRFERPDPRAAAFEAGDFNVPAIKGRALEKYQEAARVGALESTIDFGGSRARAGLWQQRAPTDELRRNWLLGVGWTPAEAANRWHQAGGAAPTSGGFPSTNPKAGSGVSCDMDHIVELQFGGTNVPNNLAALDSQDNQASGRQIWAFLRGLADSVRSAVPFGADLDNVVLSFQSASGTPSAPCSCGAPGAGGTCNDVDFCAKQQSGTAAVGPAGAAAATRPYPIKSGAMTATLNVPATFTEVLLHEGDDAGNRAAAELIPGLILEKLCKPRRGQDQIRAFVESDTHNKRSGTRVPIVLQGAAADVTLNVAPQDGVLSLAARDRAAVNFTYPWLSRGTMRFSLGPDGGLAGRGRLTPSIPLLRNAPIDVTYEGGRFAGSVQVPKERLRIPGVRVTESTIGVELAPRLRASGTLAFTVGRTAQGRLTADADFAEGFRANGTVTVQVPGTDRAEGQLTYQNGELTGFAVIDVSRMRFVSGGSLRVDYANGRFRPSGTVTIDLPGGNTVGLEASLGPGGRVVFTGRGEFRVPGLDPINAQVRYDGENVSGRARTGVTIMGLRGTMDVQYRNGRFSGQGTINFDKGRARGSLTVRMSEARRFSGEGSLQFQLMPNLVGRAGIVLSEDQRVRVSGAIEFPQPIRLFRAMGGDRELFSLRVNIPIPGVSVGPVGVVARIEASLGAAYGIGPGELRNTRIVTEFNPFEENTDLEVEATTLLVVPAHAGLRLSVSGAVALDAVVASVGGGIRATGEAMLRGGFSGNLTIRYRQGVFTADAEARIDVTPVLRLSLTAYVFAEVGWGPLSTGERWEWELAAWEFPTGFLLGVVVPVHYASNEPFQLPSARDIRWSPDPPSISLDQLLTGAMGAARGGR